MDQKKTGYFLRELRKTKGLTQEQLAEHLNVSGRTVSRWETGTTMPDLDLLIELADLYDIDIRELIDGERKNEEMDKETKDTLKKVADYAEKEKKMLAERMCGPGVKFCVSVFRQSQEYARERADSVKDPHGDQRPRHPGSVCAPTGVNADAGCRGILFQGDHPTLRSANMSSSWLRTKSQF